MSSGRRLALPLGVGLPLLAVLLCAVWVWTDLHAPYAGWKGTHVVVEFEDGTTARAMLERLRQRGVLRSAWPLRGWLLLRGGASELHQGEYRFESPIAPLEVLESLRQGRVWLHPVTIPEGLTLGETAERLAEAGVVDRAEVIAAFRDPRPIRALAPSAADLEGFLFPDTYHLPRTVAADRIVRTMLGRFQSLVDPSPRGQTLVEAAEEAGLTLLGAVTLASMIEKETSLHEERPRISRVFHNRLRLGMRLQCDPTVRYALGREGRPVGRLTREDLRFASPWNTYVETGLPPGPICSPGAASLWAAVRPGSGDELYFVARPGGGHTFSSDLASHQKAVREWKRYARSSR